LREQDEQGAKHYVTAVVTKALAEGTNKFFKYQFCEKFDRRKNRGNKQKNNGA